MPHRIRVALATAALLGLTACTSSIAGEGSPTGQPVSSGPSDSGTPSSSAPPSSAPSSSAPSSPLPPSTSVSSAPSSSPSSPPTSSTRSAAPATSALPPSTEILRAAITGTIADFNPYNLGAVSYTDVQAVARAVLPMPMTVNPDYTFRYNADLLTEAPKVTIAGGAQTVVYTIRSGAVWSDGSPITGADFAYVWNAARKAPSIVTITGIDRVTGVASSGAGKRTVTVTFSKVYSDWQTLFSYLLPARHLLAVSTSPATALRSLKSNLPISGGPLRVASASAHGVSLRPNPRFAGAKVRIGGIDLVPVADTQASVKELLTGGLDVTSSAYADETTVAELKAAGREAAVRLGPATAMILFNTKRRPLSDVRVRRAIALAIDRPVLGRAYGVGGTDPQPVVGNMLLPPTQPGYRANDVGLRSADQPKARTLLRQAGYSGKAGAIVAKGGKPLTVSLLVADSNVLGLRSAQLAKAELGQVGIGLMIETFPASDFFSRLGAARFDMLALSYFYAPGAASSAESNFACDGGANYAKFCDRSFDRDIAAALSADHGAGQVSALNDADATLWKDVPLLPIVQRQIVMGLSPRLHGAAYNPALDSGLWDFGSWTVS